MNKRTLTTCIATAVLALSLAAPAATNLSATTDHNYQHTDTSNHPDNPRCSRC